MPGNLNYSKWDNLELSDDSDVEVHPNVDKRSFIRWKQRDIHEKRDERREQKRLLSKELELNQAALVPTLKEILQKTSSEGHAFFSRRTAELRAGREARGSKDGPDGPTPDDMILSLLLQVVEEPSVKGKTFTELDAALVASVQDHLAKLEARTAEVKAALEQMEREDERKITSENIREGWSAGHVAKAEPEPAPQPSAKAKGKRAASSTTTTTIETLNSPAASAASASASSSSTATPASASASASKAEDSDDDEDDEIPDATSAMLAFAALPSTLPPLPPSATALPPTFHPVRHLNTSAFEAAYRFLGQHRELLRPATGGDGETTDALLVEAFGAQQRGQWEKARRCVEKALMVQYCQKLGPDGVMLFFKRMSAQDGKAAVVFMNDVLTTYARIAVRCAELAKDEAAGGGEGEEQIQLVAEDPNTVIGFEIPDGPPPEKIELEGELAAQLSPEAVRDMLQRRWEIWQGFSSELREALTTKELERVNKVLGKMKVDEAEQVVGLLDEAGILSFSSREVRDETGRA